MSGEDVPREYDRTYTDDLAPHLRIRLGYSHDRGEVTRFVLQLEYQHDGAWHEVVRYDHDPESEQGHDVEIDGLHIDIYRDDTKLRSEYVAPPMPAGLALDRAEDLSFCEERIPPFTAGVNPTTPRQSTLGSRPDI